MEFSLRILPKNPIPYGPNDRLTRSDVRLTHENSRFTRSDDRLIRSDDRFTHSDDRLTCSDRIFQSKTLPTQPEQKGF